MTGDPDVPSSTAFFTMPDGTATAMRPDGADVMYPSNDHPRDTATFTFRLDVPAGVTAVANGVLAGERPSGGWTTRTYRQNQPMATELTQIAVGDFVVTSPGEYPGPAGRRPGAALQSERVLRRCARALRAVPEIGEEAFARLQRGWVARHRDASVSTDDFIDGTKTPPMRGIPTGRPSRLGSPA